MVDLELTDDSFANVVALLEEYAEQFKALYKKKLKDNKRYATGRLYNSVDVKVEYRNLTFTVVFEAADYYKWIENGRKETKHSGNGEVYRKILEWIRIKGIKGKADPNTGKFPTEQQLAYGITNKIHEFGYEGTPILKESRDEMNETLFMGKLQEALQQDFDNMYSIKVLDDINKKLVPLF